MDDLVILVHGTFAGDKDRNDEGDQWWQRTSVTWKWFQSHLPTGTSLPDDSSELFQWSGANSQAERLEASTHLLALLIELERQGRGYHLVGHSHGGSVIWEALVSTEVMRRDEVVYAYLLHELVARKLVRPRSSRRKGVPGILSYPDVSSEIKLNGLRSWTTVGTPFLHYLPRRRWLVNGWPSPTLSLHRPTLKAEVINLVLMVTAFFSMLIFVFSGLGWASALGQSIGWFLAPFVPVSVAAGVLFVGAIQFMSRRNLADAVLSRERAGHYAIERFAGRWLGLWTPSDEAIAVLMSLTNPGHYDYLWLCSPVDNREARPTPVDMSKMCKMPLRLSLPVTSVHLVPEVTLWAPLQRRITPAYLAFNRWLAPRVATWVSGKLLRTTQGSDLPGAVLVYASPWPLPLEQPCVGLPEHITERLENRRAATIVPVLRQILITAALEGEPLPQAIAIGKLSVDGQPLLHTSYFDDPDVLRLIVLHITRTRSTKAAATGMTDDDELDRWLNTTLAVVESRFKKFCAIVSG